MSKQQPPEAATPRTRRRAAICRRNSRRVVSALSVLALLAAFLVSSWHAPSASASAANSPVATASTAVSQAACVAPPPGMTAWLPGDGTPEDISGNNNHGTPQNGAAYAPGKVDQAFSLTGASDYVVINNSPSLMSPAVSVDLWAYPTSYGPRYNRLVEKGGAGATDTGGYSLEFNICQSRNSTCAAEPEGIVSFVIWLEGIGFVFVDSLAPLPLNQWTHITGTFDGSQMSLYINGQLQGTAFATMGPTTDAVSVGAMLNNPVAYNFPGLLDELEIFNRALTPAEVQSIVAADSAGKCKPPKDADNDGILDDDDNCPSVPNPGQQNNDGDSQGDACDADDDNDTVPDTNDNCPLTANPDQADNDLDGLGDACDADDDNDGILDGADNCHFTANADQTNTDGDAQGDACDPDDDNDGVADGDDNCPLTPNPDQLDTDNDGQGNACDGDADGDTVGDTTDNCP
jgi:hypothetical protein